MLFSQLHLERLVFEVRYDAGYLYWDRSGHIFRDIITQFPQTKVQSVNLLVSQATWVEEGLILSFNSEKCDISQSEVAGTKLFKEVAARMCDVVFKHLELNAFTRAGLRFVYIYPTPSKEDADRLLSTSRLFCPDPKSAEPFGHVNERELMLRVEGEQRGYAIRLSAAQRQVTNAGIIKPLKLNADRFHPNVVTFDVDCYTRKPGDISMLSVPDFVRTSERMLEENLMALVGVENVRDERSSQR